MLRKSVCRIALLLFIAAPAVEASPAGNYYEGWLWESGVYTDFGIHEEFCFGNVNLDFALDLNFVTDNVGTVDVCWSRKTEPAGRSLVDVPFVPLPTTESRSTRPMVSAGGNLYEAYGEDVVGGVGQGEGRFGTVLSSSGDNLIVLGNYETDTVLPDLINEFRPIDLFVKSTSSVKGARTAQSLVGTSWRAAAMLHSVDPTDVTTESVAATVASFDLLAAGVCSYSVSTVFPDFTGNNDVYAATQTDDATNMDDRYVTGGREAGSDSACSYAIDGDGYLVITRTIGGVPLDQRFVVSDDDRYLVVAPALAIDNNPQMLFLGYRAASGMATNTIDGNYLFYMPLTEYGADGNGASAAGFGTRDWQESENLGRGMVVFDSSVAGTTPAGEAGNWYSCDIQMVVNNFDYEFSGSSLDTSISLGNSPGPAAGEIPFSDCNYQLATDGGLSVHVVVPSPDPGATFEGIFRGYVNDNGEVLALLQQEVVGAAMNVNKDTADVKFLLGMKYTGVPDADDNLDGLTNLQAFQFPLPPVRDILECSSGSPPVICSLGDVNGDGLPDIASISAGAVTATIVDGLTGAAINSVGFGSDPVIAVEAIADQDGNGAAEIAVLATRPSGQVRLLINDSLSGAPINTVFYGSVYAGLDMAVLPDTDGNGAPELAVLGVSAEGGLRVQARDALTDADTSTSYYGNSATGVDVQVIDDLNGNGAPEIVVNGRVIATGQGRVQVKDAVDGTFLGNYFFGASYAPLQLAIIGDVSGDGLPDFAQLGQRADTGAVRVQVKASSNGPAIANAFLGNTERPVEVVGVGDANGDGLPDVAVLLERSNGTGKVVVRDGQTGDQVRNIFMGKVAVPEGLARIADVDGNGEAELAALGDSTDSPGTARAQVKDSVAGTAISVVDFP